MLAEVEARGKALAGIAVTVRERHRPAEHRVELLSRVGLTQKVIHSGLKSLFTIAVHGVCRQGDDGNATTSPFPARASGLLWLLHSRS